MKPNSRTKLSALRAAFATVGLTISCTTPRYVGTVTDSGTWVHRGYGVILPLTEAWVVVAPGDPSVDSEHWPRRVDERIDLDGDGRLDPEEMATFDRPLLRLRSRTATATWVDVDVRILSQGPQSRPLEQVARSDLATFAEPPQVIRVPPGFEGWVAEGPERRRRVVWVDQEIVAERGVARRQIVRLQLRAPKITTGLRRRFDRLVEGLVLARRAARVRPNETWLPGDPNEPSRTETQGTGQDATGGTDTREP